MVFYAWFLFAIVIAILFFLTGVGYAETRDFDKPDW